MTYQIFIKGLEGRTFCLSDGLSAQTSVVDLKNMILKKEGIPPDQQRLIYAGRQMEDYDGTKLKRLADYNCESMSTLYLLGRVLGGGEKSNSILNDHVCQLMIKGTDGKTHIYNDGICTTSTVLDVKNAIYQREGLPICEQRLIYAGKEIQDYDGTKLKTLMDYQIENNSIILLVLRGKGGSLLKTKAAAKAAMKMNVEKPKRKEGEMEQDESSSSSSSTTTTLSDEGENIEFVRLLTAADGLTLTDNPDVITFEDDKKNPRAKLACGHGITPDSLLALMRSLIDGKQQHVITCPAPAEKALPHAAQSGTQLTCGREIEYPLAKKIAQLTSDEKRYFEERLSVNYAANVYHFRECPVCKSSVIKDDGNTNVCVSCSVCKFKHKRTTNFCWLCVRTWKGNANGQCGNYNCQLSASEAAVILAQATKKVLSSSSSSSFPPPKTGIIMPSLRACPNKHCLRVNGIIIMEHAGGCKHLVCRVCKSKFCFVCLSQPVNNQWKCGDAYGACPTGVAPSQTKQQLFKSNQDDDDDNDDDD